MSEALIVLAVAIAVLVAYVVALRREVRRLAVARDEALSHALAWSMCNTAQSAERLRQRIAKLGVTVAVAADRIARATQEANADE